MCTYQVRYRIQIIFYKLIRVLRIAGNNLTQLERKMIGVYDTINLGASHYVYIVYITRQGKPFLSGLRISNAHVLTVATHIEEINACPENYKVHYKIQNNPGIYLTPIDVNRAWTHRNYVSEDELSPYNVGIVEVSFSIYNQH